MDSNQRRLSRRIYSPLPLAARATCQVATPDDPSEAIATVAALPGVTTRLPARCGAGLLTVTDMSGRELRGPRPAPGRAGAISAWAVGESKGQPFAVSRRCRHQLADMSKGSVDADGCLVCPWHQSAYDVTTGAMVRGPRGFLGYHGPVPVYRDVIRVLGRVVKLRRRPARADGALLVVSD